jgi:hypothetical protein
MFVDFEARGDAMGFTLFGGMQIGFRHLFVGDEPTLQVVGYDLDVVNPGTQVSGNPQVPVEQLFVAVEEVVEAACGQGQAVGVGGLVVIPHQVGRGGLVKVVEDARVLDHPEARVEIKLVRVRVHDTGFDNANQQRLVAHALPTFRTSIVAGRFRPRRPVRRGPAGTGSCRD